MPLLHLTSLDVAEGEGPAIRDCVPSEAQAQARGHSEARGAQPSQPGGYPVGWEGGNTHIATEKLRVDILHAGAGCINIGSGTADPKTRPAVHVRAGALKFVT